MFGCVGIISMALLWLLYEADWMRLRLLVGPAIMPLCDGCGANHGTVLHAHAIKVFGGDWREYHVCANCLDSIEHHPNKKYEEAAQRVTHAWTRPHFEPGGPCAPYLAFRKWKGSDPAYFAKKYKNWPQTYVLYVDGKKRIDWHNDSWTAEAPKNFGKAYKVSKAKVSK